jgi:hypothetical protein
LTLITREEKAGNMPAFSMMRCPELAAEVAFLRRTHTFCSDLGFRASDFVENSSHPSNRNGRRERVYFAPVPARC